MVDALSAAAISRRSSSVVHARRRSVPRFREPGMVGELVYLGGRRRVFECLLQRRVVPTQRLDYITVRFPACDFWRRNVSIVTNDVVGPWPWRVSAALVPWSEVSECDPVSVRERR